MGQNLLEISTFLMQHMNINKSSKNFFCLNLTVNWNGLFCWLLYVDIFLGKIGCSKCDKMKSILDSISLLLE